MKKIKEAAISHLQFSPHYRFDPLSLCPNRLSTLNKFYSEN